MKKNLVELEVELSIDEMIEMLSKLTPYNAKKLIEDIDDNWCFIKDNIGKY